MYKPSMSDIKNLRARSGAGIKDCKNALASNNGDFEAAMDYLRTKGIAKAAKKASRSATEGMIHAYIDGASATIVEINCETDFVARTPDFKAFVNDVAKHITQNSPNDVEDLLTQSWSQGGTVQEVLQQMVLKTGENIQLRRFSRFELQGEGLLHSYIHTGSRLGVLVEVGANTPAKATDFADDLAMHIAAARPDYVSENEIPSDVVQKEFDIQKARAIEEGKPEHIAEKMVTGRIRKWKKEISLMDQVWTHDDADKEVVGSVVKSLSSEVGDLQIRRFSTFALGEGLAKKENNFAQEVAAMTS